MLSKSSAERLMVDGFCSEPVYGYKVVYTTKTRK